MAEAVTKEVGIIKNLGSDSVFSNPMDKYTRCKKYLPAIKKIAVSSYGMLAKEVQDISADPLYFTAMVRAILTRKS